MVEVIEEVEQIEEIEEMEQVEAIPYQELSESQKSKSNLMKNKLITLKVAETLKENDAQFFGGYSLEELVQSPYRAGSEFNLNNATLRISGNDDEVYYMVVSDLSKLSSDIKYFKNKVLEREGTLPEFDKVELNFSSADEDFRAVDFVESIEIKKGETKW